MPKNINFVRDRQRWVEKAQSQDQKLMLFSSIALGIIAVVGIVAGISHFLLNRSLASIVAEQKSTKTAILAEQPIEESYTVFAQKLRVLTELFGNRQNKQEALTFFSNFFGPGVIISQLSYSGDNNEILTFSLSAQDIFTMERVFEKLKSPELLSEYPDITRGGLSRNDAGVYSLKLTVILPEIVLEKEAS
ncbi:MAG: hypothetical protein COU65_02045 [Candidatus Pacebacteria bacterium CG10_big_fil_rev_8_21_14_0_10_42_12]|nr:hypothetical protein [Candidatus Paceibacterota bacterium]PIR62742.1 MAG: hypothetical protein COU65_02045 [Candidatus Pacebacteria bacterium CG10_big_fil_rev_8_21_14_0_10_42_12]